MLMDRRLLTPAETSTLLGVKVDTLARWRWLRRGPRYVKVGHRVAYDARDLEAWIAKNTRDTDESAHVA